MTSFWTRQKQRISTLGLLRTIGYYIAAVAERVGIGLLLSFEYGGNPSAASSPNVTFVIIKSMSDWTDADLQALRSEYSSTQIEFFHVLFARGDKCVVAKWAHTEVACVGWIEKSSSYIFSKGRPGFRIHACYTFPSYRGRGLYPQTLAFACKYLQSNSKSSPIFIDTSLLNHASIKGIGRAGFVPIGKFVTVRNWKWGWHYQPVSQPPKTVADNL